MSANTTKPVQEVIHHFRLDDLHPSPTNRPDRSGFDDKSIAELAESIRGPGIIEPLIVRKNPQGKGYEIVCGERRWTAARLIKLATAPCVVRELTDSEAREIQIIENLQREGLHPVEEAKGYYDLLSQKSKEGKPIHTIDSLAKKIGKSTVFIYGRLKLLKMPEVALRASYSGKLSASNALLLARIPDPKLALKATLEVLDPYGSGDGPERQKRALDDENEPMSYRKAKEHIQNNYMVRLKGAPFDQEDEELVRAEVKEGERLCGGKCSDCPWRTGNMRALFQDVDSADVCTNPTCFKRKKDAAWKRASEKAKAQGHTLLRDGKASQLFRDGQLSDWQHEYVDVRGTFPGEKKKTWEQVLGEHLPDALVQARDDRRKVHFLIPMDLAREAAKKAGCTLPKSESNGHSRYDPEEARRQEEARRKKRERAEIIAGEIGSAVFEKAKSTKPNPEWWRWMAQAMTDGREEEWAQYLGYKTIKEFTQMLEKASEDQCRAILVAVVWLDRPVTWEGDLGQSMVAAAEFYKVDSKKLIAEKTAQFKAQEKLEAEAAKATKAETKPAEKK
jgi:ParB/RepB/Spo0J family partition protein